MFEKCLISNAIKEAHIRGYCLNVVRKFLAIYYGVNIDESTLSRRYWRMYLSGKLKVIKRINQNK